MGFRTVRFAASDEVVAMPEITIETKNTFVHFAARDPLARRQTCSGALFSLRSESESPTRRQARAVTCQPQVVVPDRRSSCSRSSCSSEDASPCFSARRSSFCTDTPTASERCVTPASFTCGLSQRCVPLDLSRCAPDAWCPSPQTPLQVPYAAYQLQAPLASPRTDQWGMQGQQTPPFAPMQMLCSPRGEPWGQMRCPTPPLLSPPCSPHMPVSAWAQVPAPRSDVLPQVSEKLARLQQEKKSKKQKVVLPAKESEWTLLLRHLPLDLTPDALIAELQPFLGSVDFFYLPTNFETKKNLGYAFVNFNDKRVVEAFKAFWLQTGIAESEELPVQDARVQGYAANVDRFRSSSVMAVLSQDLKPRVFVNGVQKPFPEPAKRLPHIGNRFRPTGE